MFLQKRVCRELSYQNTNRKRLLQTFYTNAVFIPFFVCSQLMVDGQTGPSGDNVQRLAVLVQNKEIEAAPIHLHLGMVATALVTRLSSNRVTMEPAQVNTHKTYRSNL